MKAILEFDMDDVDDRENHYLAINASAFYGVLWTLDQQLRNDIKYQRLGEEKADYAEAVRETIRNLMIDKNISFEAVR